MNKSTSIERKQDIDFLQFALIILNERFQCFDDNVTIGYKQAVDVLNRLKF